MIKNKALWDVSERQDELRGFFSGTPDLLSRFSVGVRHRRADVRPSNSAAISARQVSLTSLRSGRSFRHSLRFLRVRPELDLSDVMVP
jgi:hypothetical protein